MTVVTVVFGYRDRKRRRHASRIADRRELLVRHDDEIRHVIEAVEHGRVGTRYVEDGVGVLRGGELHDRPSRRMSTARFAGRSADASSSRPEARLDDQALQELGVEPMHVLERVEQRESRIGAEEDGRIAVGQVQVDEQRRALRQLRQHGRDVDRRGGRATPPFAPTKAKTGPPATWRCADRARRVIAASKSACRSGSARTSVTPARIPSSINAGSSEEASSMTLVAGCCRFSAVSVEGSLTAAADIDQKDIRLRRSRIEQRAEIRSQVSVETAAPMRERAP